MLDPDEFDRVAAYFGVADEQVLRDFDIPVRQPSSPATGAFAFRGTLSSVATTMFSTRFTLPTK